MTRFASLLAAAAVAPFAAFSACSAPGASIRAGYMQMAIEGDIRLAAVGGPISGTIDQDVESAFGLGDPQGAPYVRGELDLGVPVIALSAFRFSENGTGRLDAQFGNITAGTDVESELDFANVKGSVSFDIGLGPITLSPGFAIDAFEFDLRVSDTGGFATEEVDAEVPIPMAYLGAEVELGILAVQAEFAGISVPEIEDVEGTFWDADVMVELRPSAAVTLFAGYRIIEIDAEGVVDEQPFEADLRVHGWFVGGGLRF